MHTTSSFDSQKYFKNIQLLHNLELTGLMYSKYYCKSSDNCVRLLIKVVEIELYSTEWNI